MKTDDVNKWLTLAANIGVLAGIFFLAFEIRQNSEFMEVQITQARADIAITNMSEIYNSEYIPGIVEKLSENLELSFEELFRYENYLRAQFRLMDNVYNQYLNGMLGESSKDDVIDFSKDTFFNSPDTQLTISIWEKQKAAFTDEFVEIVDTTIHEFNDR